MNIKGESCSVAIETQLNFEKYCDTNVEKLESDSEDSDMYAIENWQNKAKKDDPILSSYLSDSPIKKKKNDLHGLRKQGPQKSREETIQIF